MATSLRLVVFPDMIESLCNLLTPLWDLDIRSREREASWP
jgi:hypothetical protein